MEEEEKRKNKKTTRRETTTKTQKVKKVNHGHPAVVDGRDGPTSCSSYTRSNTGPQYRKEAQRVTQKIAAAVAAAAAEAAAFKMSILADSERKLDKTRYIKKE